MDTLKNSISKKTKGQKMKETREFGWIEFSEDTCEDNALCIDMVEVNAECRGNHAGYRLLDIAKAYAIENGYTKLTLCSYPQEEDGITQDALDAYYENYGFECIGSCDGSIMELSI